jgi:hypothetical protein
VTWMEGRRSLERYSSYTCSASVISSGIAKDIGLKVMPNLEYLSLDAGIR